MFILKKGFTPDEFSIQIESWADDRHGFSALYPYTIGAYPKGKWRCSFRADCNFKTLEEAEKAFAALCEGAATVFDYGFTAMIPGGRRVPIEEKIKRETAPHC